MNTEQLADLAAVKLRVLVREHLGTEQPDAKRFGGGASLTAAGEGWVYLPEAERGALAMATTYGLVNELPHVNLVVDTEGAYARSAAFFANPSVSIWHAQDRSITAVDMSEMPAIPNPPECAELVANLRGASLDVVPDHGVWLGEINGLEVARVGQRDGECSIDIGVGAYDQFASDALNPNRDVAAALQQVVEMVAPHRAAESAPHAIGRLVRARWLRAQAVRNPATIGLTDLRPVPLLIPRPGLNETQPAVGIGTDEQGPVAVAFGVGLDLGLVEAVTGVCARHDASRALIVVPERDRHPRIEAAVGALSIPGSVVALEGDWSD